MTATRAEYTEALTLSSDAYAEFTKHMRNCPACVPVRRDCPVRDELYRTAKRLNKAVEDIVTGWAEVRKLAAAVPDDTATA
jgi:hypothetical protein